MKNKGGALFALKHDMEEQVTNFRKEINDMEERQKKSNEKRLATVNTTITIIIAVLTILITIIAGGGLWSNFNEQSKVLDLKNVNIRIDEEQIGLGQYTIILDGAKICTFEIDGNTLIIELEPGEY